eukprot:UN3674
MQPRAGLVLIQNPAVWPVVLRLILCPCPDHIDHGGRRCIVIGVLCFVKDPSDPAAALLARLSADAVALHVRPEALLGDVVESLVNVVREVGQGLLALLINISLLVVARAHVMELYPQALAPKHCVEEADRELILLDKPNKLEALLKPLNGQREVRLWLRLVLL